jgi:hypothetical protein
MSGSEEAPMPQITPRQQLTCARRGRAGNALCLALFAAATLLAPLAARAAAEPATQEGDAELTDFVFQDGEHLLTLRLHYTTLGTPKRDASGRIVNAVALLHGTGGTGRVFLRPDMSITCSSQVSRST